MTVIHKATAIYRAIVYTSGSTVFIKDAPLLQLRCTAPMRAMTMLFISIENYLYCGGRGGF